MPTWGERLTRARTKRGITQAEAAKLARVNPETLSELERDVRPHPRAITLRKLEQFYGADLPPEVEDATLTPTQGEPLPPEGLSATVPASTQSEGDVSATGEGEAASGEHYVKDMLFSIYRRLSPDRRLSWVQDGLNAANMPGKSTAGGEQ